MRDVDPAFRQGVGHQIGLEIWQIEDSRPLPLQSSQHGKFFTNRSYIILQTYSVLPGSLQHHIHYWLGRCTNQNDTATAAIKAIELNASLGEHAVQERELEGNESDRFLSYFKPCFIPLSQDTIRNGVVKDTPYQTRMFMCNGRHVARVKEVPFTRSSLSHDDIFIVDTEHKIFQFSGINTDIYERTKALDVVQYLRDNFHQEKCHVAIIEDGKFVADVDSGEFWSLFGGFAPLVKKMENGHQGIKTIGSTLYTILEGQLQSLPLKREILDANKSYILDSEKYVFTWMGRNASLDNKKEAVLVAEELITKKRKPWETKVLSFNEDSEPVEFRSKFTLWPISKRISLSESGREKVAVLLKQKGFNVKGLLKPVPTTKEKLQLISTVGKLQVWCVKDGSKESLPLAEIVKFYSSNCYIVLHSYTIDQKEEHVVYTWLSNQSTTETRATAADQAKEIANSFQRKAAEAQIFQGKEPNQFLSLFDKLILIKDDNPESKGSLFQVHQSGASKWRAVQVIPVAASLNSSSCFFLQTGDSTFLWYGRFTTSEEQETTKSIAYDLKSDAKLTALKEGAETQSFWSTLGGRQTYQSQHEPPESARNPRLFSCTLLHDEVKATEVFNFTHQDLLSDEIIIVDCYTSVFVWVGEMTSTQNKLRALDFGQKYLEQMARYEGRSLETPTFKINEGYELLLFTSLFEWDSSNHKHYHNPFERQARALKGESTKPAEVIIGTRKITPPNEKSFQLIADKAKISQKVAFKPEHPTSKFLQPKSKTGYCPAPGKTGRYTCTASSKTGPAPAPNKSEAVSALSTMFELQRGREAPPNTPIVKLSALSLKPKRTIKESPPPTPSSRATPRSSVSPAIASLTSVYESYNDRFAFAWPGMKLRHEERALSRDVDTFGYGYGYDYDFGYETVEPTTMEDELPQETPASATPEAPEDVHVNAAAPPGKGQAFFPYERLKVSSANPVLHIDCSKRESYLSNEEFQETFLMDKDTFYKLPRWKQDKYKVLFDLF